MDPSDLQWTVGIMSEFDAKVWAKHFMSVVDKGVKLNEELMRVWFSNAIMAGYDEGYRKGLEPVSYNNPMLPTKTEGQITTAAILV